MEVSQHPGQAEDSPGHRWAGILGTAVAIITLTLPAVMIAVSAAPEDNLRPASTTIYQSDRTHKFEPYPME